MRRGRRRYRPPRHRPASEEWYSWKINPVYPRPKGEHGPTGSDGASLPMTMTEWNEAKAARAHGVCAHCGKALDGNPWRAHQHRGEARSDRSFCSEPCAKAWLAGEGGVKIWVPVGQRADCGCTPAICGHPS